MIWNAPDPVCRDLDKLLISTQRSFIYQPSQWKAVPVDNALRMDSARSKHSMAETSAHCMPTQPDLRANTTGCHHSTLALPAVSLHQILARPCMCSEYHLHHQ